MIPENAVVGSLESASVLSYSFVFCFVCPEWLSL